MAKKKKQKKGQTGQQFLSPEKYLKERARSLDVYECYVSDDLKEVGEGYVIVSRIHTGGRVSMSAYLVDAYCLGVKDSFFRLRMEEEEYRIFLHYFDANLRQCNYEEAHNWVYGAIAFAEEAGIVPDKNFAHTRYMLEEDTEDVPLLEIDFGRDGRHCLVCHSQKEANRYLPTLRKHLGEDFEIIINDKEEEEDVGEQEYTPQALVDLMEKAKSNPMFKEYGPETAYTYQHPRYPASMTLENPWLNEELSNPNNNALSEELTERILSLPSESLRHDLEQIILYHLALTCDGIPDGYDDGGFNAALLNAVILLGEVGTEDRSLDIVLEVLRQSPDFYEYHFGDWSEDVFVPTLYRLGQHQLERLMALTREEGLYTYFKLQVFAVLSQIALRQPDRRDEVIEYFREALHFATEKLPEGTQFVDSTLAGLLVGEVMDINARELLPEIKALYDTGLVDEGCCGRYESVERDMVMHPNLKIRTFHFDVRERLADIRKTWNS